ncbi:20640_t:CDS:2 [Entrophospora sp. SA101]|nr:20640_t:CDS:2 [Entrophospora sp. SA101]
MSRIGNPEIDKFLQKSQLRAIYPHEVLEFIPYEKFTNVEMRRPLYQQKFRVLSALVSELRTIETEAFKQLKATQCAYCKRKNLVNAYVYETNSVTGVKTVFCDTYNSLILERKNLKVPNFTYEELEAAQAREELENYVQQKIAEIKQIRESLNQEQNNCPQCHQPLTGE